MGRRSTRSSEQAAGADGGLDLAWIRKCNRPTLIAEAKARELPVNQSARKPQVQALLREHCLKERDDRRLTEDSDDAEAEAEAEAEAAPAPAAKGRGKKRKAAEEPEAEAEAEPEAEAEAEPEAPFPLMAAQTDLIERLNKEAKEKAKRLEEADAKNEVLSTNNLALTAKCAELRKEVDAQHAKFLAEQNRRLAHEKITDRVTMQMLPTEEAYEAWKGQIINECEAHGDKPESQVAVQPVAAPAAAAAAQGAASPLDKDEMERMLSVYKKAYQPDLKELESAQARVRALESKVDRVRSAASAVVSASAARVRALEAQLVHVDAASRVRAAATAAGIDYDQL